MQDRYHSSYYTRGKYYLWTLFFCSEASQIAHVQYIKILTWLRGFRVKIANFSRLHCLVILRRDLNTKKTKPKIEKWPESVGVVLESNLIYRTWAIVEPFNNDWGSFERTWPRDAPRFLIQRGTEYIPESEAIYISKWNITCAKVRTRVVLTGFPE